MQEEHQSAQHGACALLQQFPSACITDVEECIAQSEGHLGRARLKLRRLIEPTFINPTFMQLVYVVPQGCKPRNHNTLCEVCSVPTALLCSRCMVVYYCSTQCRDKDRKNHRRLCCNAHAVKIRKLIATHPSTVSVRFTVIRLAHKFFWRAFVTTHVCCMVIFISARLTLPIAQKILEFTNQNSMCEICMSGDAHVLCTTCAQGMCGKCYIKLFQAGIGTLTCPFCREMTGAIMHESRLNAAIDELQNKLLWSNDTQSTVANLLSHSK